MNRGNSLLQSQRAMPADDKNSSGSVFSSSETDEWIKRTATVLEDLRRHMTVSLMLCTAEEPSRRL
jgi:hypothetical protein